MSSWSSILSAWLETRTTAVSQNQLDVLSPLREELPRLARRLKSTLGIEESLVLAPPGRALNFSLYPSEEAVQSLRELRDELLELVGAARPADLPLRERIWRFFDLEIGAVLDLGAAFRMEQAAFPAATMEEPQPPKDTLSLPATGANRIQDVIPERGVRVSARRRQRLFDERAVELADASKALARSIRFEDTLHEIARILLRTLGDWVIVDTRDEDGRTRRLVAHRDPSKAALATELERDFAPGDSTRGVPSHVLRTHEAMLIPVVTDAHYRSTARSPRHEELLRALGSQSYMAVPMLARGHVVGALTIVSSTCGHVYDRYDLLFAEELSSRAALAVENCFHVRRAERALHLRDEFLGIVSHDLKNPLQAIEMSAGMLEGLARSPDSRDHHRMNRLICTIGTAGRRMRRLITDLLDLSRLEMGRLELALKPEPASSVLLEALHAFEPLAAQRRVRLTIERLDETTLECERDRVYQAVANLISNAIKFTPEKGTVSLRLEAGEEEIRYVVSDTGRGIPAHQLPDLFDRFSRATDRSRGGGTGLGLSIVKAMIEAHGGRVDVSSEPGKGTCFTLHLPRKRRVPHEGIESRGA